jgi:hypothetical protein
VGDDGTAVFTQSVGFSSGDFFWGFGDPAGLKSVTFADLGNGSGGFAN